MADIPGVAVSRGAHWPRSPSLVDEEKSMPELERNVLVVKDIFPENTFTLGFL